MRRPELLLGLGVVCLGRASAFSIFSSEDGSEYPDAVGFEHETSLSYYLGGIALSPIVLVALVNYFRGYALWQTCILTHIDGPNGYGGSELLTFSS